MKRRRVKITGIGPVTPAGIGREAFWQGILEPVSRIRPYTKLGEEFGDFVAAYIDRFDATKYVDRAMLPKGGARHTLFAIVGAVLALEDAKISREELRSARTGVITGSCIMDFGGILNSIDSVRERGAKAALPRSMYTIGVGSVPSAINHTLGINGRTVGLSNQCSSGMDAIGYAASLIAAGEIDIALCGGMDAPLYRFPLVELRAAELTPATNELAGRQARPFDMWRTTGVIAEGCAMLVLEADSSPREAYSYVGGYGFANDEVNDLCGGMVDAAKIAMAHAYVHPSEVDAINAWGPGHRLVDRGEVRAMEKIFSNRLPQIPACSIKGAIGSPLGAAPPIQVALAALCQRNEMLPPTVNWQYPDPECGLNLSASARAIAHDVTLINSHGLGAVNSAIILQRC